MDVFEKIKKIAVEQLGKDPEVLYADSTLKDMEIDSLDMVELIMAIEDEFDIEFDEADLENLITLGAVSDYVKQKTGLAD